MQPGEMEQGPGLQASSTFSVRANLICTVLAPRPISACITKSPSGVIKSTWWTVFWEPINCDICLACACLHKCVLLQSNLAFHTPKVSPSLPHLPIGYLLSLKILSTDCSWAWSFQIVLGQSWPITDVSVLVMLSVMLWYQNCFLRPGKMLGLIISNV